MTKPLTSKLTKFISYVFSGSLLLWIALTGVLIGFTPKKSKVSLETKVYFGIASLLALLTTKIFSYYLQCTKIVKIMELCKRLEPQFSKVTRDGQLVTIKEEKLTKGDIIEVKSGDRIPADIRIIYASEDFKVDNSCLTGESEPQDRSAEFTHKNLLETKNIAFFSTNIVERTCKGVVINVGSHSIMGKVAEKLPASAIFSGEPSCTKEILQTIDEIMGETIYLIYFLTFIGFYLGYYYHFIK